MSLSALYPTLLGEKNGARPLITYYDTTGRIELSYTSTRNWVSKSANFLTDLNNEPRSISFDLSNHWLSVVWLLTASALNLEIVQLSTELHVSDAGAPTTSALNIRSPRDLWGRASDVTSEEIDFAREVLTFPDFFQSENHSKAVATGKQVRKLFNSTVADFNLYAEVILDGGSLVLVNGPTEIDSITRAERVD
ncbi:MAG: hypothetical protein WCJ91_05430 [Actinomycetes bacterium]